MRAVAFDIRGPMAHFRRPDTVVTHCSYPFITRTALGGLVCAILGRQELQGEHWFGLRIMKPVTTCFQEMSMLGKGWLRRFDWSADGDELIVNPHYRVYYCGDADDWRLSAESAQRPTTYLVVHLSDIPLDWDRAPRYGSFWHSVPMSRAVLRSGRSHRARRQYARCNGQVNVADRVFEGSLISPRDMGPIHSTEGPLDENSGIPTSSERSSGPLCLW